MIGAGMSQTARTADVVAFPRTFRSGHAPLSRGFARALGVFVAVWVVAWVAMGIWTRHEVASLRQLGTTVVKSGTAVKQTGDALQGLRAIPFVGGDVARIGRQVSAAGVDARRSGRSSQGTVGDLATLLGVAIAVVPSVPMIALYLLARRLTRRPEPLE